MWDEQRDFDCLSRARDICVETVIPNHNTAFRCTLLCNQIVPMVAYYSCDGAQFLSLVKNVPRSFFLFLKLLFLRSFLPLDAKIEQLKCQQMPKWMTEHLRDGALAGYIKFFSKFTCMSSPPHAFDFSDMWKSNIKLELFTNNYYCLSTILSYFIGPWLQHVWK